MTIWLLDDVNDGIDVLFAGIPKPCGSGLAGAEPGWYESAGLSSLLLMHPMAGS